MLAHVALGILETSTLECKLRPIDTPRTWL